MADESDITFTPVDGKAAKKVADLVALGPIPPLSFEEMATEVEVHPGEGYGYYLLTTGSVIALKTELVPEPLDDFKRVRVFEVPE